MGEGDSTDTTGGSFYTPGSFGSDNGFGVGGGLTGPGSSYDNFMNSGIDSSGNYSSGDLGGYMKFDYDKIENYQWRSPISGVGFANYEEDFIITNLKIKLYT